MKLETYKFDRENKVLNSENQKFIGEVTVYIKKIKIELIEISGVEIPNNITLKLITKEGRFIMPFYRHIKDFICYNKIFILDTTSVKELEIDAKADFNIEIESEKDFNLKIYFSTDRNSAYTDEVYI